MKRIQQIGVLTLAVITVLLGGSCSTTCNKCGKGKPSLAFEQKDTEIIITCGGKLVADYIYQDDKILRPYFAHVHTLDGIQVTRNYPPIAGVDPVDHSTMHPGVWMAFGTIGGQDFWRNKATIRHDKFTRKPRVRKGVLTFGTKSTMLTTNNEPLAKLDLNFKLTPCCDGYFLIWDAAFTPTMDGFSFGDQEEMGFGVRVATPMAEKNGGTIVNSDGLKGAKESWGKIALWSDYSGVISNRWVGIASMPDPHNFQPSWFHNRNYGLMVANMFGRKAFTKQGEPSQVPVAKGETFHLRWAAYIHSSATNEPPDISAAYQCFLGMQADR